MRTSEIPLERLAGAQQGRSKQKEILHQKAAQLGRHVRCRKEKAEREQERQRRAEATDSGQCRPPSPYRDQSSQSDLDNPDEIGRTLHAGEDRKSVV